jgi:hypothetical protein
MLAEVDKAARVTAVAKESIEARKKLARVVLKSAGEAANEHDS